MPMVGKLSDKVDKFKIFVAASVWMAVVVVIYTNLAVTPLWLVMIFNVLMMCGIMSRMVPSSALITAVPVLQDRGAFMSINSSLQQIAGGVAAAFAGMIVVQKDKFSPLEHYNTLGYIIVGISVLSAFLLYRVSVLIKTRAKQTRVQKEAQVIMEKEEFLIE
jgi:MFS family permease